MPSDDRYLDGRDDPPKWWLPPPRERAALQTLPRLDDPCLDGPLDDPHPVAQKSAICQTPLGGSTRAAESSILGPFRVSLCRFGPTSSNSENMERHTRTSSLVAFLTTPRCRTRIEDLGPGPPRRPANGHQDIDVRIRHIKLCDVGQRSPKSAQGPTLSCRAYCSCSDLGENSCPLHKMSWGLRTPRCRWRSAAQRGPQLVGCFAIGWGRREGCRKRSMTRLRLARIRTKIGGKCTASCGECDHPGPGGPRRPAKRGLAPRRRLFCDRVRSLRGTG